MATLKEILQGVPQAARTVKSLVGNAARPIYDDYSQLWGKGTNLRNDAELLKGKIGKMIPSNEAFRSPEAMGEWSLSAALNAPMGLGVMSKSQLATIIKDLEYKNKSTLPKIPAGNVFQNNVSDLPFDTRLAADDYFENNSNIRSIDINKIYPTQKNINLNNLKQVNKKIDSYPTLIEIDGKYYVTDGHHRISRDILSGDKSVLANIFNKK